MRLNCVISIFLIVTIGIPGQDIESLAPEILKTELIIEWLQKRLEAEKTKHKYLQFQLSVSTFKLEHKSTDVSVKSIRYSDMIAFLHTNNKFKKVFIKPELIGNNVVGYRVIRIERPNYFYTLGFREGDMIIEINNSKIVDTKRMFDLWKAAQELRVIQILIERGEKFLLLKYNIEK